MSTTIEEKGKRSSANAHALVEDENGGQDHKYSEDQTPGHITGVREHKGEDSERKEVKSKVTAGRHISGKNGLEISKERVDNNNKTRQENQKAWESDRLSVVPEQRKRRK